MDRTHSIMRIATTASPVSGAEVRDRRRSFIALNTAFNNALAVIDNSGHIRLERLLRKHYSGNSLSRVNSSKSLSGGSSGRNSPGLLKSLFVGTPPKSGTPPTRDQRGTRELRSASPYKRINNESARGLSTKTLSRVGAGRGSRVSHTSRRVCRRKKALFCPRRRHCARRGRASLCRHGSFRGDAAAFPGA